MEVQSRKEVVGLRQESRKGLWWLELVEAGVNVNLPEIYLGR